MVLDNTFLCIKTLFFSVKCYLHYIVDGNNGYSLFGLNAIIFIYNLNDAWLAIFAFCFLFPILSLDITILLKWFQEIIDTIFVRVECYFIIWVTVMQKISTKIAQKFYDHTNSHFDFHITSNPLNGLCNQSYSAVSLKVFLIYRHTLHLICYTFGIKDKHCKPIWLAFKAATCNMCYDLKKKTHNFVKLTNYNLLDCGSILEEILITWIRTL